MEKLNKRPVFKEQRINNSNQFCRSSYDCFHIRFPFISFLLIVLFKIRTVFSNGTGHNKNNSSCMTFPFLDIFHCPLYLPDVLLQGQVRNIL